MTHPKCPVSGKPLVLHNGSIVTALVCVNITKINGDSRSVPYLGLVGLQLNQIIDTVTALHEKSFSRFITYNQCYWARCPSTHYPSLAWILVLQGGRIWLTLSKTSRISPVSSELGRMMFMANFFLLTSTSGIASAPVRLNL